MDPDFAEITSLERYCALLLELKINPTKFYDSAFLSVGRQAGKMLKKRVRRWVKLRQQREMFHLSVCHLLHCQTAGLDSGLKWTSSKDSHKAGGKKDTSYQNSKSISPYSWFASCLTASLIFFCLAQWGSCQVCHFGPLKMLNVGIEK